MGPRTERVCGGKAVKGLNEGSSAAEGISGEYCRRNADAEQGNAIVSGVETKARTLVNLVVVGGST